VFEEVSHTAMPLPGTRAQAYDFLGWCHAQAYKCFGREYADMCLSWNDLPADQQRTQDPAKDPSRYWIEQWSQAEFGYSIARWGPFIIVAGGYPA